MRLWWLLVPVFAALVAAPVQARVRDDALSGAFRCAGIADSRQWLDCYYGAAQPVRAALGLPPALAGQIRLATTPPSGGQPRDEPIRDDVMSAAANCNRVASDRSWLDCYYAAAAPLRAQLGLSVPPQAPSKPAITLASAPNVPSGPPPMPRKTGLFDGLFNDTKPVVRNMAMKSFTFDKQGAFTVVLADGEVWAQSTEDEVYHPAHWRNAGPNTLVTISPDAMHTFTMTVSGEERFYKVHRIR
jgi:hypothetical protein